MEMDFGLTNNKTTEKDKNIKCNIYFLKSYWLIYITIKEEEREGMRERDGG